MTKESLVIDANSFIKELKQKHPNPDKQTKILISKLEDKVQELEDNKDFKSKNSLKNNLGVGL